MHTNRSDVVAYLSSGLLCLLRYGIIVESASYEACAPMHTRCSSMVELDKLKFINSYTY